MLRERYRIDAIVVGEHVLARVVMPVFQTRHQSGDFRNLVAERLGDLPYRLAGAGSARAVLILEEFGPGCRLERRRPIVNQVLCRSLPGRAVTVDHWTFLRAVEVLGLQGQVGYEPRLPGKDRIDRAQVGIGMVR